MIFAVLSVDIVFLFVLQLCLPFLPHAFILISGKGSAAALCECLVHFFVCEASFGLTLLEKKE